MGKDGEQRAPVKVVGSVAYSQSAGSSLGGGGGIGGVGSA